MADGPFYFAWVAADETTFAAEHMRVDEEIFDFALSHSEGDFATLTITVENPKVGFLAPGRNVWAWFAFNPVYDPDAAPLLADVAPLFFGRVVGMPNDLDKETVSIQFVARPEDFGAQKAALAEAMKVAPYWDPVWLSEDARQDPDSVLESRPQLWAIDRKTLAVSASDIINGEDGTVTFDEGNVFYDSVQVTYEGSPLRTVNVTGTVTWTQAAAGEVDLSRYCNHGAAYSIVTYTGDGLEKAWPKAGASFGGGWKVGSSSIQQIDGAKSIWSWGNNEATGLLFLPWEGKNVLCPSWAFPQTVLATRFPGKYLRVAKQTWLGKLTAAYDAKRDKGETVSFSLTADVQKVITEPDDGEHLELSFASSDVAAAIDPGGALPIGSVVKRSYFTTERGAQSLEYLLALARSRLIAAARCVRVAFEVPFADAVAADLSLRKSAVLHDIRLPGAVAGGKITAYELTGNGDSGEFKGAVTLACSVGRGGTVESAAGSPTYVEEGYVEAPWQRYEGQYVIPGPGDVAYESILGGPYSDDGGFDFENLTPSSIVKKVTKTNTWDTQEAAIPVSADEPAAVFDKLNEFPCTFQIDLKPITSGPFATTFNVQTTALKIPKTIDLEAEVVSS
ncbi:hypothetical protein [Bradyrhizobium sp. 153]|uniref:hypothetical protein n=1 Tax=Bradyrhizobium sp. 153 TaxID=2782627 RepID=UPI001FF84A69|nr:hypothetical protein [Bradyrhizobium sp. 153]MCK1668618.1 hypothetical protein [Bradyrhizobium sp. 153]